MHDNLTLGAAKPTPLQPLKVKDAAVALDVHVQTVYALVRQGSLRSYRVGSGRGTIRIPRAAFQQYLEDRGIPAGELGVEL